jgi:hypothetical protein
MPRAIISPLGICFMRAAEPWAWARRGWRWQGWVLAQEPTGGGMTCLAVDLPCHAIVGRVRSGAAFSMSIVANPVWLVSDWRATGA